MKTLNEVKGLFGIGEDDVTELKFFHVVMEGNPYTDLSNHATSDIQVMNDGFGGIYAATLGTVSTGVATEVTI